MQNTKLFFVPELSAKYHKPVSTILRLFHFEAPDTPEGKYKLTSSRVHRLCVKAPFTAPRFKGIVTEDGKLWLSPRVLLDITMGNMLIDAMENCLKSNDFVRGLAFVGRDTGFVYRIDDINLLAGRITAWQYFHRPVKSLESLGGTVSEGVREMAREYRKRLELLVTEYRREFELGLSYEHAKIQVVGSTDKKPEEIPEPKEAPDGNTGEQPVGNVRINRIDIRTETGEIRIDPPKSEIAAASCPCENECPNKKDKGSDAPTEDAIEEVVEIVIKARISKTVMGLLKSVASLLPE